MGTIRFIAHYFEEMLAGTFMVLMLLATFTNVIARYIFNSPFQWAEEFSRYSFIWLVFLGAVIATKYRRHIVIDAVVILVPRRVKAVMASLVDLFVLGLMVVMFYYGVVLISGATQPTSTLKVPQYVVYLVIPLSAFLNLLRSLGDFRRNLTAVVRGSD